MAKRRKTEILQRKLVKPLSRRELQVLIALGEGKTTPEIRSFLRLADGTVNAYLERLKKKLEVRNIHQLIRAAALLREGIIPSPGGGNRTGPLRLCPRCQKLFSAKLPKEEIQATARPVSLYKLRLLLLTLSKFRVGGRYGTNRETSIKAVHEVM